MTKRTIRSSSLLLASGTVVSRAVGFVRTIVLAQALGVTASAGADAFAVANQLPNNIYALVAGGVFSATLVPAIVKSAFHHDGGKAYLNKLITAALSLMVITTLVATALAPALILLYASTWTTQQLALATAFAYVCLPQIFFYGLYALLGEILNGRHVFGPFTWVPVANNIIGLVGLSAFLALFGPDPFGLRLVTDWTPTMVWLLAGTATLGVAIQSLLLLFFWRRIGLRYRPDFRWRGVGLGETSRIAAWTFGMLVLTQVAGIIETNVLALASGFGASVFTLQTAWLVFMLPHSVIAVSLATAYFTRMSEDASAGENSAFAHDVDESVRRILLFLTWAMVCLFSAAFAFSTLFASSFASVSQLGLVIMVVSIGLPSFSVLFLVMRAFFALGDGKTPFFLTLFQAGVFSLLAIGCSVLPRDVLGIGVAASLSLAGIAQTFLALFLLRRRVPQLTKHRLGPTNLRALFAAVIATGVGLSVSAALGSYSATGFAVSNAGTGLLSTAVIGLSASATYLGCLWLARTPELRDLLPRRDASASADSPKSHK